jgi:anti-sigma factor RsiW
MTSSSSAISVAPLSCQRALGLIETFVDGELTQDQTLSVEEHLNKCDGCQAHAEFLQVVANSVQHAVHDSHTVDATFLARVSGAVEAEIAREVKSSTRAAWEGVSWQSKASTLALAAGVAAWFSFRSTATNDNKATLATTPAQNATTTQNAVAAGAASAVAVVDKPKAPEEEVVTIEGALDRLIDAHSSPSKPQITTADLLPVMEPEVGVRIELPKLEQYGARWEGASVVPVRKNQQAVSLRYKMPNHRMTLYVFDASKLHVRPPEHPQRALNAPLYVGQWRGYTVAAKENRGVGYALAADMDDVAVTRMISEIH